MGLIIKWRLKKEENMDFEKHVLSADKTESVSRLHLGYWLSGISKLVCVYVCERERKREIPEKNIVVDPQSISECNCRHPLMGTGLFCKLES